MLDQRDPSSYADAPDVTAFPLAERRDMPQPGWGEIFRAQREVTAGEMPTAEYDRTWDAWEPILEELNRNRPANERRYGNPAMGQQRANDGTWRDSFHGPNRQELEERAWGAVERARKADPKAFPSLPKTLGEFRASILAQAKQRREQAQAVLERNGEWGGSIASLAGGVVEGFRDPINLMTLSVGGFGKSVAVRMLTEGLINAGIEGLEQPLVAEQKKAFGEETTAGDVIGNIGTAFVGGAAFQGASEIVEGAARTVARKLNPIDKQLAKALADGEVPDAMLPELYRRYVGVDRMTPTEKAAVDLLERDAHIDSTSPFQPGSGREAHAEKLADAMRNLAAPEPPAAMSTSVPTVTARPAPATAVDGGAALKAKIRRVESGGNDTAANPNSSAYGRYQFTAPTWKRYYRRRYGDDGLTDAQILAKRRDPSVQERLMDDLIADNTAALARIGARPTAGNLYLMHFAGQGGAQAILRAAPDTPIERVLGEGAVKANPFLRGKTAEDVIEWAHAKMGSEAPSGPVLKREGFGTDEEWLAAQREVDAAEADLARANQEVDVRGDNAIAPAVSEPRILAIDPSVEPVKIDLVPLKVPIENPRVRPLRATTDPIDEGSPIGPRAILEEQPREGAPGIEVRFDGQDVATAVYRGEDGAPAGVARVPISEEARSTYDAASVYVVPEMRRQGVATRLYQALEREGVPVREQSGSGDLTPDGAAFATAFRDSSPTPPASRPVPVATPAVRDLRASVTPAAQRRAEVAEVADGLRAYDDPVPSALREATDSLEHDVLMALDRGDLADLQVRIGEEGEAVGVRAVLDGLEKDAAAINAARACMVPNRGMGNVAG